MTEKGKDGLKCRVTRQPLEVVLDLGKQPLGNGFSKEKSPNDQYFFDLVCGFSEEGKLFQLVNQPERELMFHDSYAFSTSTSRTMVNHFNVTGQSLSKMYGIDSSRDFILEIGSNDGTFLQQFVTTKQRHLGVEPSSDLARIAQEKGVQTVNSFFDSTLSNSLRSDYGTAKLIFSANVMCHISEIFDVLQGVKNLLSPDGVFVFEDPYLGDVIEKKSYDQIYDEHFYLFSVIAIDILAQLADLELIMCEHITTHGGSMRYHLAHKGKFARNPIVKYYIEQELQTGLDKIETYIKFGNEVEASKNQLKELLATLAEKGAAVSAYGATSKSTTIYNYAEIDENFISKIYDNSPSKIGRFSPGVGIPIVDEKNFRKDKNDVVFLSAWNHSKEIIDRNSWFTASGGKWLTHVPTVRFLDEG